MGAQTAAIIASLPSAVCAHWHPKPSPYSNRE